MKMKSFAMLAMSGLLATSFAYIAPAMADDSTTNTNGQSMQSPADNSMSNAGGNNGSNAAGNNASQSDVNSTPSNDEGSPDTASGDDDY